MLKTGPLIRKVSSSMRMDFSVVAVLSLLPGMRTGGFVVIRNRSISLKRCLNTSPAAATLMKAGDLTVLRKMLTVTAVAMGKIAGNDPLFIFKKSTTQHV